MHSSWCLNQYLVFILIFNFHQKLILDNGILEITIRLFFVRKNLIKLDNINAFIKMKSLTIILMGYLQSIFQMVNFILIIIVIKIKNLFKIHLMENIFQVNKISKYKKLRYLNYVDRSESSFFHHFL